jgi:hypothetical protein
MNKFDEAKIKLKRDLREMFVTACDDSYARQYMEGKTIYVAITMDGAKELWSEDERETYDPLRKET